MTQENKVCKVFLISLGHYQNEEKKPSHGLSEAYLPTVEHGSLK